MAVYRLLVPQQQAIVLAQSIHTEMGRAARRVRMGALRMARVVLWLRNVPVWLISTSVPALVYLVRVMLPLLRDRLHPVLAHAIKTFTEMALARAQRVRMGALRLGRGKL